MKSTDELVDACMKRVQDEGFGREVLESLVSEVQAGTNPDAAFVADIKEYDPTPVIRPLLEEANRPVLDALGQLQKDVSDLRKQMNDSQKGEKTTKSGKPTPGASGEGQPTPPPDNQPGPLSDGPSRIGGQ
jgi:hypothetical protein